MSYLARTMITLFLYASIHDAYSVLPEEEKETKLVVANPGLQRSYFIDTKVTVASSLIQNAPKPLRLQIFKGAELMFEVSFDDTVKNNTIECGRIDYISSNRCLNFTYKVVYDDVPAKIHQPLLFLKDSVPLYCASEFLLDKLYFIFSFNPQMSIGKQIQCELLMEYREPYEMLQAGVNAVEP